MSVEAPEHLDLFLWRPIKAGLTTMTELRSSWTLLDLADAHDFLDLQEELDRKQARKMKESRQ